MATAQVDLGRPGVGLGGARRGRAVREGEDLAPPAGLALVGSGLSKAAVLPSRCLTATAFQKTVTGVRRFHRKFRVLLPACPVPFKNRIPVSLGNTAQVIAEVREAEVSVILCGQGTDLGVWWKQEEGATPCIWRDKEEGSRSLEGGRLGRFA